MFYATALGMSVFPLKAQLRSRLIALTGFPLIPSRCWKRPLDIGVIVAYSTFYVTRHQLGSYGAMGYSKEAIENGLWKAENPGTPAFGPVCLSRNPLVVIKLLLRKNAKHLETIEDPLISSLTLKM